jgi:hypothetical protein
VPKLYGPYPVNRAVQGISVSAAQSSVARSTSTATANDSGTAVLLFLQGNAAWLIPNIRDGILMHTGEWPGWTPPMAMPNSAGVCAPLHCAIASPLRPQPTPPPLPLLLLL